jgi:hypothetical protein
MMKNTIKIIATAVFFVIAAGTNVFAEDNIIKITSEKKVKVLSELEQRGKLLRKVIDETYKQLADAKAIKSMGNGRNFITDVVVKYIPVGTPFDDAEAILRAAGFKVGPRGQNPVFHDLYEVMAVIDYYVPTLFGKTSIDVSLEPASSNNWNTVKNIKAEIIRQFI